MSSQFIAEALESRRLLSASGSTGVFDSAVTLDREHIQAELLKFKSDCVTATATMLADVAAIKTDDPGQASTVAPLVLHLRSDVRAMNLALAADRLAESKAALADESVIAGDLLQMVHDRGNKSAETTDRAKLKTDRIQLQNDLIAGLNSRIATREADYTTIGNDEQAITSAVESDPHASTKLQADVAKWASDKTTNMNTLLADLQKIASEREQ